MPTEVIRPKFDVVRGWPNGSAYDRTFEKVVDGSGNALTVRQGSFVTVDSAGRAKPATVGTAATAKVPLWLVVEGNDETDSYAGNYLGKCVGIKGSYEVLLSETMFVAASYTVGAQVTVIAGKVAPADDGTNDGVNGYVMAYDSTSKELRVAFTL